MGPGPMWLLHKMSKVSKVSIMSNEVPSNEEMSSVATEEMSSVPKEEMSSHNRIRKMEVKFVDPQPIFFTLSNRSEMRD